MKNITTIISKELKRFFTDRRMLVSLILPGLLIYVIYSLMGGMISGMTSVDEDYTYTIAVINEPENLSDKHSAFAYLYSDAFIYLDTDGLDAQHFKDRLAGKDMDLLVVFEDDFFDKVDAYDIEDGLPAPQVKLFYNSAKIESGLAYQMYTGALDAYEHSLINKLDINREADTAYDLATEQDSSIMIITMMLPLLLIIFLFSGAMATSVESIAGEKERGTIATLLLTPVKRREIALGKILALGIVSLVSAASSFIGLILSLPKLMAVGGDISFNMYGFSTYLLLFFVLITTTLIFIVLISLVSAFAKSIKEATALAMPLMIINMLIGISSMTGLTSSSIWAYFIPVYNSVQSITSILGMQLVTANFLVTILTNLAVVALGIFALAKAFNSEKFMFNK